MPSPTPTPDHLREAALQHLGRYATTSAGLLRVLDRQIQRWAALTAPEADAATALRAAARAIVADLQAQGLVDDAAFADMRARRLIRSGHSRRAVAAHLAARGVDRQTLQAVIPAEDDLAAALAAASRRRIGPFRATPPNAQLRQKDLAALARAGFDRYVSERALDLSRPEAEALVLQLKRG
jgi:regulatory protein